MARVVFTDPALEDISSIAEFISRDSAKYAIIFVSNIFERVEVLKKHPRVGRIVPETSDDTIREIIEGSYRIIYRLHSNDHIDILTVHHSANFTDDFLSG
jgi:addiction module RelE/StbE family toxin